MDKCSITISIGCLVVELLSRFNSIYSLPITTGGQPNNNYYQLIYSYELGACVLLQIPTPRFYYSFTCRPIFAVPYSTIFIVFITFLNGNTSIELVLLSSKQPTCKKCLISSPHSSNIFRSNIKLPESTNNNECNELMKCLAWDNKAK